MQYNFKMDSETRLTITHSLRCRIEQLEEELKHAQKLNETIKIENTITYWQGEIERTTKALESLRNNSTMIY